jgi:hypothetical protein
VGKFKDIAIDEANRDREEKMLELYDKHRSLRGKRARQRGNAFEREVASKLNGKRTGMYGGKNDVEAGHFVIQCKVGLSYPERLDKWLRELTPKADQLGILVVGDSPGAGAKRRALAIIDFDDFIAWYGKEKQDE